MSSKIRVSGDGTPTGTKVYVVTDRGEEDISNQIKSLTLKHNAGGVPVVELELILTEFNLTGTHRSKHDRDDDPPTDPRTGMVRWV